jgi:hypothetical protein
MHHIIALVAALTLLASGATVPPQFRGLGAHTPSIRQRALQPAPAELPRGLMPATDVDSILAGRDTSWTDLVAEAQNIRHGVEYNLLQSTTQIASFQVNYSFAKALQQSGNKNGALNAARKALELAQSARQFAYNAEIGAYSEVTYAQAAVKVANGKGSTAESKSAQALRTAQQDHTNAVAAINKANTAVANALVLVTFLSSLG